MHPNELKNCALVAANAAEREGFSSTARALMEIAMACAEEAKLSFQSDSRERPSMTAEPAMSAAC
jgi:hypothetical protein